MKLQKAPSSISKTVKFPASVTSYLRSEDGQHEHFQSLKGGLLKGSKVLRAVQVPSKVMSMSVVDSGTGGCYPLPQIVNSMTGILAVGLAGGDVLLLDLCRVNYDEGVGTLPSSELRDELWPCQILSVSVKETGQDSLENKRVNAARTGDHLAVVLNESYLLDKTFALTLPDGKTFNFPKHRVDVTALMYIPRIASVVVGFSFGSFQIWNLMNLTLEYISPILSNPLPVVSFGFQEPSDDPRNYCYLWAVHSNGSSQRQRLPFAVMYALQYQNKELEFVECKHQFEFDLDSEDSGTAIVGGRIQENDLSLALFVWETWGATCPGSSQMALFDLNQWYKDQMPSRIMKGEASTYMTLYSLDDVVEGSFHATNPLLDVRLDPASISQFTAVQSLEEHYYPSALSFESLSLLGEELVVMNHPGVQRDILSQLEQSGPSALLHPTKLFHHCNAVGLKPVYTEVASTINCPVVSNFF
ncbi:hypothetical protein C0J52_11428 [Blattella germanica]|nr:hypothetical protein C0J52_11428 [Blattella germanica]